MQQTFVGINSHGSAGDSHSHGGGFPFHPISIPDSAFYSHSRGLPIPIGNHIPMHVSTLESRLIKFKKITQ